MFEKPVVKTFQYGNHTVTLETGVIARQATAAVMVTMDDTSVFVSVVGKKEAVEGQDFFPLTVNYQERTYAAETTWDFTRSVCSFLVVNC